MTETDYNTFFEELIISFGGKIESPAGFDDDNFFYSCILPPICVPKPERLTAEQRAKIVEFAKIKYGF